VPADLGDRAGFELSGGAAEHVVGGRFVAMVGALEVAGEGGVLGVAKIPMRPTVGRVGASINARGCRGGRGVGRRRSDGARLGGSLLGGVGAMVASAVSSGGEATILIGGTEVGGEVGQGFVGFRLGAPVATGNLEETSGVDNVIAKTNDSRSGRDVVAGGCEADAIVELREEFVDWGRRIPRGSHAKSVGVELDLGDRAPSSPKVGEDGETGDAAESKFRIGKFAEIVGGESEKKLVAESLVGLLVGTEGDLIVIEDAVDLTDLGSGGADWMNRIDETKDGRDEGHVAGDLEIGGRGESEGQMAMDAIAGIGGDGGGVGVELGLGEADSGVGRRRGDGGDGGKDGVGEGGGDRGGGEGRSFLHGGKEKKILINFY
jgi:hypothetical protein